jgi:steroid 5-alpha reductase family enzyme
MTELSGARARVVVAYVVALVAGAIAIAFVPVESPFWKAAAGDAVATVVVFGFSLRYDNSSFYDPYWSVIPPALGAYWMFHPAGQDAPLARQVLVLSLVTWWGIRLTYNWGRHWRGLDHEDWRYVDFRNKTGKAYWLVSLGGIHFFPTVQVLASSAGLYLAMTGDAPLGPLDAVAAIVTAGAITIEMVADRQLHDFVSDKPAPDAILKSGLWSWSRHPNYFGEVTFWWGLCLFGLAALSAPVAETWWLFVGPVAMTAMFFFVSIPLIDERMLAKRPHYADHMKRVSRLIPWPPQATESD